MSQYPTHGRESAVRVVTIGNSRKPAGTGRTQTGTTIASASTTDASPDNALVTNEQIKLDVEQLRKNHGGCARLWEGKHKLGLKDKMGPWLRCDTCDVLAHKGDTRESLRGRVCDDCYEIWMFLAKKAWETQNEGDPIPPVEPLDEADYTIANNIFSAITADAFNTWTEDEDFVHDLVLHELAKHSPFTEKSIDYLLFRVTGTDEETVPNLRLWREEMVELYDFELEQAWNYYDPDGGMELGLKCLQTRPASRAVPKELNPGPTIPSYKVLFETKTGHGTGKCMFCNGNAKLAIDRLVTQERRAYCKRHYVRCGEANCKSDANHTRFDGIRVCHQHARGKKECYPDTFVKEQGYVLGAGIGE